MSIQPISNVIQDGSNDCQLSAVETQRRTLDKSWKCREAFTTRPVQPTLEELAEEFGMKRSTVGYWSASQNWSALRSAHLQTRTKAEGIAEQVTQRVSLPVTQAATAAILATFEAIIRTVQDIDHARSASTRAEVVNTCSFALKNTTDACKNIGIVGLPKTLKEVAEGTAGGWSPALTQQINVILGKNDTAKVETVQPATPVVEVD